MVLLLDNYDSFTYNLYDYIVQSGKHCFVIRNNEFALEEVLKMQFSSVVISPGPKTPDDAGITMPLIAALHNTIPILGVCLGHQAIGQYYGARLAKAQRPMHGKTSTITCSSHPLFDKLAKQQTVMRYHSLVLKEVENTPLQTIAETDRGEVMAIAHPIHKVAGLQFHPESILTPCGLDMIRNWFAYIEM